METIRRAEMKWKKTLGLIKNTIHSSQKLSRLLNKYLIEKNELKKRAIYEKIDFQFKKMENKGSP
jgi:hypothetical protein